MTEPHAHPYASLDPDDGPATTTAGSVDDYQTRHTVDTITSDALDALYETLAAAEQTSLARQLATADKAFIAAHLRATRNGAALDRTRRALASTILQARHQAARAEEAEAAIARVREVLAPHSWPYAEVRARDVRRALDGPPTSPETPPQHLAKGTNAEDCPACEGTNPDYPFLCPGP